jgi:hypothetical protein
MRAPHRDFDLANSFVRNRREAAVGSRQLVRDLVCR